MNFCHYAKLFSSFFFKWRCFNKNCFLSWKCFRKKKSRSLYRDAIRKGLITTPGKIILVKKKCSPTCKAHLSCYTRKLESAWWRIFLFMDETQCWWYGRALGVYSWRSAEFYWHFSTVFNLNHAWLTAAQVNYSVNSSSLLLQQLQ